MIRHIPRALALCTLVGCGGQLESDYTINLVPHTLQGQAPFVDGRVLELIVIEPDGLTSTIYHAGAIEGGQLTADELPPVAAGSTIGVLVENNGGNNGEIDNDLVVAWGSAIVPDALATGEVTVTVDVLVAEIGDIGDMGSLSDAKASTGAGVAMVPNGDVYIFGGAGGFNPGDEPTDRIQKMTAADTGVWKFDNLSAKLPDRDNIGARWGLAATVVEVGGDPLIFVSGGRTQPGELPGVQSRTGFLLDPATDKITWGGKDSHDELAVGRSEHRQLLLDNGKVLIYGGYTSSLGTVSIEIFNAKNKTYEFINAGLDFGEGYPGGASLGPGGALICGGGILDSQANTTNPTNGCSQITLGGVITAAENMPVPVMGHGMTMLADGRILATGGVLGPTGDNARIPATADAWIYDGSWSPLTASMRNARVHHEIIPTPDGNAIIIGGTEQGGAIFPNPTPAVVCAELFDAKAETFRELSCTGSGAGAFPQWSKVDTDGAFVLAGYDAATEIPMGDDFGFIAFSPAI